LGNLFLQKLKDATGHRGQLIEWVSEAGDAADVRCALVGGCVRDVLLGVSVGDLDFVVEGNAKALAENLVRHHGGHMLVHAAFGTVTWRTNLGEVDFAMSRTERYGQAGALPEVQPASLEDDLGRRDFSVNAMAVVVSTPTKGLLLDPFDGRSDLQKRILRVLHSGSFVDDPTRAWRAARYEGRLGLSWSEDTVHAWSHALAVGASYAVSLQRIGNEWDKLCGEANISAVIDAVQKHKLFTAIHPDFPSVALNSSTFAAIDAASQSRFVDLLSDPLEAFWIRLALELSEAAREQFAPLASGIHGRTDRWQNSPIKLRRTTESIRKTTDLGSWGECLSLHSAPELLVLSTMSEKAQSAVHWWIDVGRGRRTVVTAKELMTHGVDAGPQLGRALQAAQRSAWRGESQEQQWGVAFHAAKQ